MGSKKIELPRSRLARLGLGILLILGGLLWFLPVLGMWMIPLGLMVLATDSPPIRRFNRRMTVKIVGWWNGRKNRDDRIAERNGGS